MRHVKEAEKPKKKGVRIAVILLLIVLVGGFIFGATMVTKTVVTAEHEAQTFREIAELVDDDNDEVAEDGTLRKYDALYKKNPDFFGWLKIEDTEIDYPVMYRPGDNETYLHTDFYGDYSESGMLFMDGSCPSDGSTALIYGHHMRNGSMFGSLPKFCDEKFYEKHKIIWFDTRYEQRDYEIVSVLYSEAYDIEEEQHHYCYYKHTDLSDEAEFNEYIAFVKANALYETGVTPKYGERILTLSTCNYHTEDGRLVVVAREVPKEKTGENKQ